MPVPKTSRCIEMLSVPLFFAVHLGDDPQTMENSHAISSRRAKSKSIVSRYHRVPADEKKSEENSFSFVER